jgi:hypothetical protein
VIGDGRIRHCTIEARNTDLYYQSAKEFKTSDEFASEAVKHIETTLARSLFNCDE